MDEHFWPSGVIPLTKAEYRSLKEKAERFDNYLESIKDSIPHVSLADYEVLEDKLEAIKTEWSNKPSLYDEGDFYRWEENFEKLLGGDE